MQENRSGLKLALLDLIDRRAWRRRVSMNTHTSSLTLDLADVGVFSDSCRNPDGAWGKAETSLT